VAESPARSSTSTTNDPAIGYNLHATLAGGLGSRHTGRCRDPADRAFASFFSGAGPYPPKGFALTGGTATDVAGAVGGVVVVAVSPRVMPPP
jgi:hypothetical protein